MGPKVFLPKSSQNEVIALNMIFVMITGAKRIHWNECIQPLNHFDAFQAQLELESRFFIAACSQDKMFLMLLCTLLPRPVCVDFLMLRNFLAAADSELLL